MTTNAVSLVPPVAGPKDGQRDTIELRGAYVKFTELIQGVERFNLDMSLREAPVSTCVEAQCHRHFETVVAVASNSTGVAVIDNGRGFAHNRGVVNAAALEYVYIEFTQYFWEAGKCCIIREILAGDDNVGSSFIEADGRRKAIHSRHLMTTYSTRNFLRLSPVDSSCILAYAAP